MDPVKYAKELVKVHGLEASIKIAKNTADVMNSMAAKTDGVPAYSDEMEFQLDDTGHERITVEESVKSKRIKKNAAFWSNVTAYLRNQFDKKKGIKKEIAQENK